MFCAFYDVAYLTGIMASELKMKVREAKRAVFCTISQGKDISRRHACSHRADYAKRFGENPRIVQR
jgi:ribonuclease Y